MLLWAWPWSSSNHHVIYLISITLPLISRSEFPIAVICSFRLPVKLMPSQRKCDKAVITACTNKCSMRSFFGRSSTIMPSTRIWLMEHFRRCLATSFSVRLASSRWSIQLQILSVFRNLRAQSNSSRFTLLLYRCLKNNLFSDWLFIFPAIQLRRGVFKHTHAYRKRCGNEWQKPIIHLSSMINGDADVEQLPSPERSGADRSNSRSIVKPTRNGNSSGPRRTVFSLTITLN